MSQNYQFQASAIRHFVPLAEKEDPDSPLAENLRAALQTIEWLSEKKDLVNKIRELNDSRPDLEYFLGGGAK